MFFYFPSDLSFSPQKNQQNCKAIITALTISKIYISKYTIQYIFMCFYWQPSSRLIEEREIMWYVSHIDTDLNQEQKFCETRISFPPHVAVWRGDSHCLACLHLGQLTCSARTPLQSCHTSRHSQVIGTWQAFNRDRPYYIDVREV